MRWAWAAVLAAGVGTAQAAPYSANYVFGDSLSDRGNLAEALGRNFPSPPFYQDSFTNGPVAVQVLAQRLGLQANPSLFVTGFTDANGLGLTAGTNYAVAGATAGNRSGEGVAGANLPNQLGAFLAQSGGSASSSALYTVFIGGNDVRTAARQGDATFVTQGVTSELSAVRTLIGAGATNLLVVNVPDVGAIPEFTLGLPGSVATATADTVAYNAGLASGLSGIAATSNASIKLFDFYTFQNALLANPASLGITNTTQPCYVSYGGVTNNNPLVINPACGAIDPATGQAANIGQFAFWDPIHPTAKLHDALGNALYDYVQSGPNVVPEPASLALLGFGFAGLAALRRRAA